MDIFERIKQNPGAIGQWSKQGHGYFMFPKLEGEIDAHMKFRGHDVLNWSLNNYLGLANNPEIRKLDVESVEKYGLSNPMGSRLMTGHNALHEQLENEIAKFVQKEDAYVLNSFYQGVVSVIDCLCGRNDVFVYDPDVHSSVHDGIRLHPNNKRFTYLQNNFENLEVQMKNACEFAEQQDGGVLLITEGILGLTGELVPLDKIAKLKEKYNFRWIVCDPHGLGIMGATGIGAAEELGVQDKVDVHIGNFEKTIGLNGGFVASEENIVNYLRYNMRSQTFSEALSLINTTSAINRLLYIQKNPQLRKSLWNVTNALQRGLRKAGCDIGNTKSPITPIFISVHNMQEGLHLLMDLRENFNIFCVPIIFPYVQKGQILLRLIPTATHSLEDVEFTVDAIKKVKENLRVGKYRDDNPLTENNNKKEG